MVEIVGVPAAAARQDGHRVLRLLFLGGKYMSDLITHSRTSVGGAGGREAAGNQDPSRRVVVVGVGRILREPITILKRGLPRELSAGV